MRSFGLIGYPLAHSFSAEWFAEMFRREGIRDAVYANYPLGSIEELPALLAEHPLLGFNVTAPYKRAIMDYLDQIDPTAERIGAVNCAVRQGDTWKGYNVDWIGFAESLMALIGGECPHALIRAAAGRRRQRHTDSMNSAWYTPPFRAARKVQASSLTKH